MKRISSLVLALLIITFAQVLGQRKANFPQEVEYADPPALRKDFWIFIMAGQSNMAGRGLVEARDTLPNSRILTIDSCNNWIQAKEPLHFYEPERTGLDCGLSFGRTLLDSVPEEVTLGIIPCAVGGSSIYQWNLDSARMEIKLLSNIKSRVDHARQQGVIKGIIWHQGEAESHPGTIGPYGEQLKILTSLFRDYIGNDSLPIIMGELGPFMKHTMKPYSDSINREIHKYAQTDPYTSVISTGDLTHKGDSLHFDDPSLRIMGERYAHSMLEYPIHLKDP
jgi:hypothetical protein